MNNYFKNRNEIQEAYRRHSATGINKKLKIAAWVMLGLCFALLTLSLILLLTIEDFPYRYLLILRGSAGVCATIFFILYAILIYRTNRALWHRRPQK